MGKKHNSNYYWLNSLIWYYVEAYKKGTTEQDTVEIDFGGNKKYTYSLNILFRRIKNENEITDRNRNHYVYYGKGKVFSRNDGGKMNILKSAIGKEKFIYVLSSKNINEKYKGVFLNIENLDCVAISEIDLDSVESTDNNEE